MRIDRGPRRPLALGSNAAPQIWIHCLQPSWNSGTRIGPTAHPCGRHGLLASWRRGSSLEHAHRASRERGGSLVRQAPGHRSCLEPPPRLQSPLPFKQPVRCPPTATPFLSFLYISSELAVAVQSLVNDALLLLTTLQFPGLHSLYRCLDLGDTPQLAPALGLFTCFDLPTYAPRR